MKIFISGASGLVGGNCLKHFLANNINAIGTYFSYALPDIYYFDTLNLNNPDNFDVMNFKPDVIVHCGAMTHVDACETSIEESYNKTVQSTLTLIGLANTLNAKLVYLSTDYVFDGKRGPYFEDDAVNPLSIYAKHKLEAEEAVIKNSANHLVLRITNVYGNEARNKNFIARIIDQCMANETLKLTLPYDQYATPVNAYDVARAMLLLLQNNKNGLYHIASTDYMNRVDLAMNVLKHFPEAQYDLNPISTATMNQAAKRPLLGGLQKVKFSETFNTFIFTTVDDFVKVSINNKK
jgi:dTDP-4-dehydrorhamnose reductase